MAEELTQNSTQTARSNLERFQWPKGVSGNPGGRPKSKPFEDELRKVATPAELAAIAKAVIAKAKEGDIKAAEFVADRLDGKLPQPVKEQTQSDRGSGVVMVSAGEISRGPAELPDAEAEDHGEE